MQPSLIRVEADEATYNLHIILRFELEQEILSGELALEDLPEAWNARMEEYLGIEVPDDAHGVLQDVHWSGGAIGYFPTYALGNVISVQLWDQLRAELPDLDTQFEQGEFGELGKWLRENLHRHGRKYNVERDARADRRAARWTRLRTCATSGRSSARSTDCRSRPARRPKRLATEEEVEAERPRAALRLRRRSFVAARTRPGTTAGPARLRHRSPG